MKKIVAVLRPFDLQQNVYVYENGNKIDAQSIEMTKLNECIVELADKYNIKDISLLGPKAYSKGIKKQIEKEQLTKYNNKELNIEYI